MIKRKTALYRHYNADGALLYVGISLSAVKRLGEHRDSLWANEITRIEIQYFEDRRTAEKAEKEAIKTESPIFNKRHMPKQMSELEQAFLRIFNSNDDDEAIYFSSHEVAHDFMEQYGKWARKMQRKPRTLAHSSFSI